MRSTIMTRCICTVIGMLMPMLCLGHGVNHRLLQGSVAVEALYDDGRPMAFCDASVFSPADPDQPFQTGMTDPGGRFAFVPDTHGAWGVTVDDGMGHAVNVRVTVGADQLAVDETGRRPERGTALLVGLCLVFGLFGVYSLVRRSAGHARSDREGAEEECECTSPKA